jgi:hypothetical protein
MTINVQVFVFHVTRPEVAILNFEVIDEDITRGEFIAFTSVPVTCIRTGIRNCQLYNERGRAEDEFVFASLTVRTCIEPLH